MPFVPAASVPPLKVSREFTPPRMTEFTFVSTPLVASRTKLFVAAWPVLAAPIVKLRTLWFNVEFVGPKLPPT